MFIVYQHYYEQYETNDTSVVGLYTTLELAEAAKAICESNPVDDYYYGSFSWTITEMPIDVMPKVVEQSEVDCNEQSYHDEAITSGFDDWCEYYSETQLKSSSNES
jgi:hypothetical protein